MRNERNILLAGVATLALIVGTSFASAQQAEQEHGSRAAQSHTAPQQMNKAPTAPGKMGQATQAPAQGKMAQPAQRQSREENRGSAKMGQNAEQRSRAQEADRGKGATVNERERSRISQSEQAQHGQAANEQNRNKATAQTDRNRFERNNATAQNGRNRFEGMQANTSGVNVRLNDEQRSVIRTTVINAQGAPRAANVKFDVTVGTVVPRGSIEILPVPPTLVEIEPRWRGFLYFVYQDEVIIVSPRDMRIVAVVSA